MCVPACHAKIANTISRRNLLKSALPVAAATVAATGLAGCAVPYPAGQSMGHDHMPPKSSMPMQLSINEVVDLTHTLGEDFPTYFGVPLLSMETLNVLAEDGFNMKKWTLTEHVGTHMDAPFHFSEEDTADEIPVSNLVGPLAVVDIRARAEEDADTQVTPDDLMAWEAEHGEMPPGVIVAMNSGWDEYVNTEKFRNADDDGVMHFPGYHIEAVEFLLGERDAKGIMVDTLSLDHGPSADFAVHYRWLPSNRWGVENAANLGALPASGATVIVGGPKIAGATGGPSRVIALM
ncbi:MAG: cyclase family protein [Chloroflexota bacterium]